MNFITINKKGEILSIMETASVNEPTVSQQDSILLKVEDLPKGQLVGVMKINLEKLVDGEVVFEPNENQVRAIDLTTEEGKAKIRQELNPELKPNLPKAKDGKQL